MDHTEPPPAIHSNDEYDNADAADDGHVHRVCVRTRQHSPRHGDVMPSLPITSRRRLEQPPPNNMSRPRSTRMNNTKVSRSHCHRAAKSATRSRAAGPRPVCNASIVLAAATSVPYILSHTVPSPPQPPHAYLISMTTKAAPTARDNLP